MSQNLIVAGVATSESPDTAGEQLLLQGADISSLVGGALNTEHVNSDDIGSKKEQSESEKTAFKEFKGFNVVVGRILSAKKVFVAEDCEDELQKQAWNELGLPFLWVTAEVFSGDDMHPNAQAAAVIIKNHLRNPIDGNNIGFSVEGNILKRDGNILEETVIRRLALTLKPANKTSTIKAILPNESPEVSAQPDIKKAEDDKNVLKKYSGRGIYIIDEDFGLTAALAKLRKTLDAGCPSSAPSALSGGAALQPESHLDKLEKLLGKKPISRQKLKRALPNIPDLQLGKIEKLLRRKRLLKHIQTLDELYKNLFENGGILIKKS